MNNELTMKKVERSIRRNKNLDPAIDAALKELRDFTSKKAGMGQLM